MKKPIAAIIAVTLGLGGAVGLGVASASAHDHTDGVTCQSATVDLANYDGAATVKVTLDGAVIQDTTPFGGEYHWSQPLTFDADHQSHTLKVEVLSGDAGYSFTHTDVTPASCYTPPPVGRDVPIIPAVFHPATCTTGSTFDTFAQDADVKYTVTSPPVGTGQALAAGVSVTIEAHVKAINLLANGGLDNPNDYSVTFTGQALVHNASCVGAQTCSAVGTATHESDDNAAVLEPDGWHIFNNGNGKPTDVIFPASGNLQGITHFTRNVSGSVGNGIFTRFIVDLSADGGSTYNSLSITDVTATQASIADVGSKNVFLGKTIAQIADLYPDAVYHAISFQTGSSYASGDGAVLTGFSDGGNCVENFTTTPPVVTHRTTDTHTDIVCSADGVGGGTYTETVTNYTTNPVWNETTGKFDLVETVDAGYPVITTHDTDASLGSCPINATPVAPTVTAVCSADDTVTLATTNNVAYAITASDKTGATVTATPAENTVLVNTAGWTSAADGTATFQVVYDNSACPIQLAVTPNGLAFTGSDPTDLIVGGAGVLFLGLAVVLLVGAARRRQDASL